MIGTSYKIMETLTLKYQLKLVADGRAAISHFNLTGEPSVNGYSDSESIFTVTLGGSVTSKDKHDKFWILYELIKNNNKNLTLLK